MDPLSPVIEFYVCVSDWVVLEPHQVEVENRRKINKDNSFLSLLQVWPSNNEALWRKTQFRLSCPSTCTSTCTAAMYNHSHGQVCCYDMLKIIQTHAKSRETFLAYCKAIQVATCRYRTTYSSSVNLQSMVPCVIFVLSIQSLHRNIVFKRLQHYQRE